MTFIVISRAVCREFVESLAAAELHVYPSRARGGDHHLGKSNNPLETTMLLVDFNLAEHLEYETRVKGKQIHRMGTPPFIARAVELGGPVPLPPLVAFIPGIPNSPDIYNLVDNKSHDTFKHDLNYDAESIFWLLLYWAMVVQPEGSFSKENIDAAS